MFMWRILAGNLCSAQADVAFRRHFRPSVVVPREREHWRGSQSILCLRCPPIGDLRKFVSGLGKNIADSRRGLRFASMLNNQLHARCLSCHTLSRFFSVIAACARIAPRSSADKRAMFFTINAVRGLPVSIFSCLSRKFQ